MVKGKDRAWHIERLRIYAKRRWSMKAVARVLMVDSRTIEDWAKKHDIDFSNYDRKAAKRRTLWFARTPMGRWETQIKLLAARDLKNGPPVVSGELVKNIIEWEWQGLARKRLWIKLRFAAGRRTCYNAGRYMSACAFSPKRKNRTGD